MKKISGIKVVAENRRARFDYDIVETFEAGIELLGHEVKSARRGQMGLAGSYAVIRNGQVWLLNASIPPYQPKNTPASYDPARTRRLLLRADEIATLSGRLKEKSVSLIPVRAYLKHGLIKLELALARSRKKADRREYLKKREHGREMRQEL